MAQREGSLEAPTRHPIDWKSPEYRDEGKILAEAERVFEICHGCRRCVSLCNTFPKLFDFIDAGTSGEIDGGLKAVLTAEARDEESAKNLREVVQGFLALAKLQTSSKPEFQRFVNSLEIRGTGNTVALSLDVPAQLFVALSAVVPKRPEKQ